MISKTNGRLRTLDPQHRASGECQATVPRVITRSTAVRMAAFTTISGRALADRVFAGVKRDSRAAVDSLRLIATDANARHRKWLRNSMAARSPRSCCGNAFILAAESLNAAPGAARKPKEKRGISILLHVGAVLPGRVQETYAVRASLRYGLETAPKNIRTLACRTQVLSGLPADHLERFRRPPRAFN